MPWGALQVPGCLSASRLPAFVFNDLRIGSGIACEQILHGKCVNFAKSV